MEYLKEELMLDYLYELTQKEYGDIELSDYEEKGYVTIVDYCHKNGITIEFGIEI